MHSKHDKFGPYREVFRVRDPNTGAQRMAGLALVEIEDDPDHQAPDFCCKFLKIGVYSYFSSSDRKMKRGAPAAKPAPVEAH